MRQVNTKYIVGFAVIISAIAYLGWSMVTAQYKFIITPTEFMAKQSEYIGNTVKLSGAVLPGSIVANGTDLKFIVADDNFKIPVHYVGIVPNNFREDCNIVATGVYDPKTQIFEAAEMLTKCASKYKAK